MSFLDIVVVAILISFTVVSAAWGVLRQAIALGGLILGLILAGSFSEQVAKSFFGFIDNPQAARGAAFLAIVIVLSLTASVIASILYFVVGLLFLGWLDHLIGAVLGFIQGVLAVGVFLVGVLLIQPDWTNQQLKTSVISNQLVKPMTDAALLVAPNELKDTIRLKMPK
ncbi:MAG: CvpA family protein [Chloroflexi bacterium]|uniref:CvpA family protein n=1 Tax=Candidatus Chlorohelix allophototropha TaxID=3003348 RepID=A0A8T7M1Y1_9CHLR|nr:CvpA family protein [Chloroflexota bacterium]WJW65547.1 CvpA family protein [Chloroflexota bacterium L227-S17]